MDVMKKTATDRLYKPPTGWSEARRFSGVGSEDAGAVPAQSVQYQHETCIPPRGALWDESGVVRAFLVRCGRYCRNRSAIIQPTRAPDHTDSSNSGTPGSLHHASWRDAAAPAFADRYDTITRPCACAGRRPGRCCSRARSGSRPYAGRCPGSRCESHSACARA